MPNYTKFEKETDPFNPKNKVSGYVEHGSGKNYGKLLIKEINGVATDQIIYGTPKFTYPFNKDGALNFPHSISRIEAYDKLDGTNVMQYHYDNNGYAYVTYKTRLRPFLSNNYGSFLDMWKRMLEKYPGIKKMPYDYPLSDGFAYELYGAENTHLIDYDVGLDCALLFGLMGGNICPPSWFDPDFRRVPSATLKMSIESPDDFPKLYQANQEQMDSELVDKEGTYEGSEGEMWYGYLPKDNSWVVFKCKPHQVEQIHWSSSTAIHRNTIRGAALNTLESFDEVTVAHVKTLLTEEFDAESIKKSESRIKAIVDDINANLYYFDAVECRLDELPNVGKMTIGNIMRYLVTVLDSKDKRIYKGVQMYLKKNGLWKDKR